MFAGVCVCSEWPGMDSHGSQKHSHRQLHLSHFHRHQQNQIDCEISQMPTEDNRYNYSEKGVAQMNTDEQSMNIRICMMIKTMTLMVVIQSR